MRIVVVLAGALLLACGQTGSPAQSPASIPVAQSSPTVAPPTTAPPRTSPPAATSNPGRADLKLLWAAGTNISDVDDVYEMITHLKEHPGIHEGFGNEIEITVVYDPRLVTPATIRRLLLDMGFPTEPPS